MMGNARCMLLDAAACPPARRAQKQMPACRCRVPAPALLDAGAAAAAHAPRRCPLRVRGAATAQFADEAPKD